MSSYLRTAVVTSNVSTESAIAVLSTWLDQLFERYEFGFRGIGGVMRLKYAGDKFEYEDELPARDAGRVEAATELSKEVLEGLLARHQWFSITGSIGMEDVEHALDIRLAIVPSRDAEAPAVCVAHLDERLYRAVEPDGGFDVDAMKRFRDLMVALGAHPLVEGFHATNIETFGEVAPFSGEQLRASLVSPTPVAQAHGGGHFVHGIVTGIQRSLMTLEELEPTWGDGELFETVTGFCVLNCLVEIDESLFDDEDEDETN